MRACRISSPENAWKQRDHKQYRVSGIRSVESNMLVNPSVDERRSYEKIWRCLIQCIEAWRSLPENFLLENVMLDHDEFRSSNSVGSFALLTH